MSTLDLPEGNCPKCGWPAILGGTWDKTKEPCEYCGGTGEVDTLRRLALMKMDDGALRAGWPAFPGETTIVDMRRTDEDMRREEFTLLIRSSDLPVVPDRVPLPRVCPQVENKDGRIRFVDWGYREAVELKPPTAEELTRMLRTPIKARV